MSKNVFRKSLVIGIIILFFGASAVSGISIQIKETRSSRGDTLYVGGSEPGNYSKIQDAIDNASSGDIVFVYDDSSPYYENIIIDKSIDFIGENRDTTVIDGNNLGDVVYVSADFVNITGFTITNSGSSNQDSGIKSESDFNCFFNNNISYNFRGIFLESSNNNVVTGNTVSNNIYGISLSSSCNYNTITGNTVSNNIYGISLSSSCNYNTITGNTVSNNNFGISLSSSCNYNTITGNNANSNNYYGISLSSSCNYNTITGNNASNNAYGIRLDSSSNYNTITGNTASNNYIGILLDSSSNYNTITGNTANSNNECGILLDSSSNYNTITGNTANSNNECGIYLGYSSSYNTVTGNNASNNEVGIHLHSYSNNNTIKGNNVSSNNDTGIYLDFSSNNNLLYHNNLIDNTQNAYDDITNYWDNGYPSGGNYWDDYTGIDNNGDGIGDTPYPIPGGDNEDRYPLMEPWINVPPSAPTITAPTSGKPNTAYDFTFNSVDSDGDDVRFVINWGDGDNETTPYTSSGSNMVVSHIWTGQGTYTITVYAEDEFGAVSGTTTSQMIIEKSKTMSNPFLNWLQNHPNMFPILQRLLLRLGLQ